MTDTMFACRFLLRKPISFLNRRRLSLLVEVRTFTATKVPSGVFPPKTRPAPPSPINSSREYSEKAVSIEIGFLSLLTILSSSLSSQLAQAAGRRVYGGEHD